jgi:hypothetical protein
MQKLTRQSSHVVGRPYCMGNAVSTQPLKIRTAGTQWALGRDSVGTPIDCRTSFSETKDRKVI